MELRKESARSRDGNDDWVTLLPSHYAIILSPGLILLKKKRTKIPEKATETGTNYRLPSKKESILHRPLNTRLSQNGWRERGRAQSVSRCNNPSRPYPVFLSFCPNVLPVSRSQPSAAMSILRCFAKLFHSSIKAASILSQDLSSCQLVSN